MQCSWCSRVSAIFSLQSTVPNAGMLENYWKPMASMGKVMAWQNSCHSRVSDAWVLLYHHGKGHGMAKLIPHGFCHEVWVLPCCMSYPMCYPIWPWASGDGKLHLSFTGKVSDRLKCVQSSRKWIHICWLEFESGVVQSIVQEDSRRLQTTSKSPACSLQN